MKKVFVCMFILLLALSVLGCGSSDPGPDPEPPVDEPFIDAKALIDNNCAQCHGLDTVYTERDKDAWPAIVADMARKARRNFTDEEVTAMTEYLQENYGK